MNDEAVVFKKCVDVVDSCDNVTQLESALKYVRLALRQTNFTVEECYALSVLCSMKTAVLVDNPIFNAK